MKGAVILLSGGIDSATTLAATKNEGFKIFALSFDYGQRHRVELESAKRCADYFNVEKHLIIKFDLREIGGSALTSDVEVPKSQISNPKFQIPITYVPARNTIFLSFALGWAEVLDAEDIFIGANAVDYSGYPDCRPEFISAFENMANLATKVSVEGKVKFKVHAPLINLSKGEIIKKGTGLGVDYSLTWSCYDPQPSEEAEKIRSYEVKKQNLTSQHLNFSSSQLLLPCSRCDSCLLRAKGFREAGIEDPLISKK